MTERPPPRRVVVTSPRMHAARTPARWAAAREIDAQSPVGEVYMRALVRAQLRLALRVCGALALALGGLPLAVAIEPRLALVTVFGIPVSWVVLGVAVYPALALGAWYHVRAAERIERDFADLVAPPPDGP